MKPIEKMLSAASENRSMSSHRRFLGYAYALVTHATWFTLWQNLLSYLRKFRMITFLFRTAAFLVTVLETGAFVLLTTALFLVILPLSGALMLGILLTALLESRITNRNMRRVLRGKRIYFLFGTRGENAFLEGNARDLARREDVAVAVISPYWFSGKGFGKSGFYCTVRREDEDLYLIRRYYFFLLRRCVDPEIEPIYCY